MSYCSSVQHRKVPYYLVKLGEAGMVSLQYVVGFCH